MRTMSSSIARRGPILLMVLLSTLLCQAQPAQADRFVQQRKAMVTDQLQGRDITNARVLAAMERVPRHNFVPQRLRHLAYEDHPLPIGHDQTISQPYIVALMTQLLAVAPGDRVLEVGTGSGYQAAVLAAMGVHVFSIEIVPQLGQRARQTLETLGYTGARVKIGDGYQGWPDMAPFDAIIVTCAPTRIPKPLQNQLAEGGRMVIPVGEKRKQHLVLLTKTQGAILRTNVIPVRFVPMVDEKGLPY